MECSLAYLFLCDWNSLNLFSGVYLDGFTSIDTYHLIWFGAVLSDPDHLS